MVSVHQHRLANGLTLLGESNSANQSAAIGFFVKTGARDETARESGVSHFLEHMMFKGTPKRSAIELSYALGNIGAQANAYTSEETTVYYGSILPEYFCEMQEILCDMLRPSLDAQEFNTEKQVILEEIALYQDRPQFYLFMEAMRDYFGDHPAGNRVLGTTQSITDVTRDEMADYFRRRYAPSNMVLAATGRFDWERFVADAEKYCGAWTDFASKRELKGKPPVSINKVYPRKNVNQAHALIIAPGVSAQSEERYAMSVLATILGDSTGSKLYWELVDKGLAESAGADSEEKDGVGCFFAYASTDPQHLEEVLARMRSVVEKPLEFDAAELERAKTKLCAKVVLGGELPMGRLMALGNEWIYRGALTSLKEIIARIRAVSRAEIEVALSKYPLKTWSEFKLIPE